MSQSTDPKMDPRRTPLITSFHLDTRAIDHNPLVATLDPMNSTDFKSKFSNSVIRISCRKHVKGPAQVQVPFLYSPMPSLHSRRPPDLWPASPCSAMLCLISLFVFPSTPAILRLCVIL